MEATLSSKNQITIPKEVREALHVNSGSKCKFFIEPDGRVVILPVLPAARLKGILGKQRRTLSVDDMNQAIRNGMATAYRNKAKRA